jgi:hypothetical protein
MHFFVHLPIYLPECYIIKRAVDYRALNVGYVGYVVDVVGHATGDKKMTAESYSILKLPLSVT